MKFYNIKVICQITEYIDIALIVYFSINCSSWSAAEPASRKARCPLVRSHVQLSALTAGGKFDVISSENAGRVNGQAVSADPPRSARSLSGPLRSAPLVVWMRAKAPFTRRAF